MRHCCFKNIQNSHIYVCLFIYLYLFVYNQSANYTMTIGGVNFFSRKCINPSDLLFLPLLVGGPSLNQGGQTPPSPPVIQTCLYLIACYPNNNNNLQNNNKLSYLCHFIVTFHFKGDNIFCNNSKLSNIQFAAETVIYILVSCSQWTFL